MASLLLSLLLISADPVFDLPALRREPLDARSLSRTVAAGLVTEEVRFRAEAGVEIFGILCYPEGARGLPAFVWSPAGLGAATPAMPLQGARRGYVGLAIDYPVPGLRSSGGFPITAGLLAPVDARQAPVYHGAVALLRAVQFLGTRPEVDRRRRAVLGSSWGGFFSTLVAGLDEQLAAAASLFGTGSLELGNPWWARRPPDPAERERWALLDPAPRLASSRVPIAWISGTNDQFYWLPSLLSTHARAAAPRHLALLPGWNHAVDAALDEQAFAWLDVHLKGDPAFLAVGEPRLEQRGGRNIWHLPFSGPRQVRAAELAVSFGEGAWPDRCWQVVPAQLRDGEAVAELEPTRLAGVAFGSVIDGSGFRSSTTWVPIAAIPGAPSPSCDGAAAWGGFEASQADFLERHGLRVATPSESAWQGQRSGRFEPGSHRLPPALVTPGLPHRLELWVRSAGAAPVQVALTDGPRSVLPATSVAAEWMRLGATLPGGDRAVQLTLEVSGALLVDGVSLRPLP